MPFGFAEAGGRFHKRVEHRLQIECRAADDLEHVRRRGLLLQRFGELVTALLLGFEQSHVLDRDGGLVGEGFHQRDLLVGERPDFQVINDDDAEQFIAFEDRDAERRADRLEIRCFVGIFRIGLDIEDVDGPSFKCSAGRRAVAAGTIGIFLRPLLKIRRQIEARPHLQQLAIEAIHIRPVGAAQPDRILGHGFEHRFEIERGAADDLEHVGGGGLLLQRRRTIPRCAAARPRTGARSRWRSRPGRRKW